MSAVHVEGSVKSSKLSIAHYSIHLDTYSKYPTIQCALSLQISVMNEAEMTNKQKLYTFHN